MLKLPNPHPRPKVNSLNVYADVPSNLQNSVKCACQRTSMHRSSGWTEQLLIMQSTRVHVFN